MSKFTPGPWRTTGLPVGRGNFGIWSDSGSVASVTKARNGGSYAKAMLVEEGHANARLIAAAPEMYEALVNALAVFESLDVYSRYTPVRNQMRAALGKADGQA